MDALQKNTLIAFLVFAVIFGITHFANFPGSLPNFKEASGGQTLLDLQPEFTVEGVYSRLDGYGESGRAAYLKLIPAIDIVFPLSFFAFLFMLGRLAGSHIKNAFYKRQFWMLPLAYLFCDFAENAMVAVILLQYPNQVIAVATILGYVTVAKRIFMLSAFLFPLGVIIFVWLKRRI